MSKGAKHGGPWSQMLEFCHGGERISVESRTRSKNNFVLLRRREGYASRTGLGFLECIILTHSPPLISTPLESVRALI